jgi:hypothetical protein
MSNPLPALVTAAVAAAAAFFLPDADAAETLAHPSTILIHTVSAHSEPGYNNLNLGLGYRDISGLTVGSYCNSESKSRLFPDAKPCKLSTYLGYSRDWDLGVGVSVGLTAGILHGYTRAKILPFILPSFKLGDHIRILYAPAVEPKGTSVFSLVLEFAQ